MNSSKERVLNLAKKILNNGIGLIEGAREMAEFDDYFGKFSPAEVLYEDYEVFMDIEDETHDLPIIATVRKHWAPEALILKDEEIKKIEGKYRSSVEKACREIIKKLEQVS